MEKSKKGIDLDSLLKKEWSYTTGAVLIALLATVLVLVVGKSWGVTGVFPFWGGMILEKIGVNADSWSIFNGKLSKFVFFKKFANITNVGIIIGAFIASLLAASFKIKMIKSFRQVVAAVIGGTLMGIGATLAMGCNIGGLFSGISALSLHGWVYLVFIFLGAIVGSSMLKKWFM